MRDATMMGCDAMRCDERATLGMRECVADELTPIELSPKPESFGPGSLVCTSLGVIIVFCYKTHRFYAVHPTTGAIERVAGCGKRAVSVGSAHRAAAFKDVYCMTVVDNDPSGGPTIYAGDLGCIRRIPLPPNLYR